MRPFIALLLRSRGPAAVARFVIAVVVDAVNRQSWRAIAHVVAEVFKARPPFADGDPAATVERKVNSVRIQAAFFHCYPGSICRRRDAAVLSGALALQAATTCSIARGQATARHECFGAALAQASPHNASTAIAMFRRFDNSQVPKNMPGQVACALAQPNWGYSFISHAVSSYVGDGAVRGQRALDTFAGLAFNYHILRGAA